MYNLVEVNKDLLSDVQQLYDILKARSHNISHISMPDFEEHTHFVKNHPYFRWYIAFKNSSVIGSLYIKLDNQIGINLVTNNEEDYLNLIQLIFKKHKPLPAIQSLVPSNFIINVSPSNISLQNALKRLNFTHIQNTYTHL